MKLNVGTKITGGNCGQGTGISPATVTPSDGLNLQLNFYRVGDDDGGKVEPRDPFPNTYFKLSELAKSATERKADNSGVLLDEWFVYQGDRFNPSEWATFTLSSSRHAADQLLAFKSNTYCNSARRQARHFAIIRTSDTTGSRVKHYEIRYQMGSVAVNESTWATMQIFENTYIPAAPNTSQTFPIIGLQAGQTYTVAVRATDEGGRITPEILSTSVTLPKSADNFVTIAPLGRSLVFSDATTPFLVLGETGLMRGCPCAVYTDKQTVIRLKA
ncbi:MAG: fibronectin type III domain-containing protein [Thiotrichaceae bacterium]